MTIRELRLSDYDTVYALWRKTPGMGLNDIDDSREGIAKYLERNPRTCFVAESTDGGGIIGAIMSGHDGRRGVIHHTCVDPALWGQHIGARLVEAALAALKAEGISKVALVVFERNARGNGFWERLGFMERTDLVYRNKALAELTRIDT
ncbi:MAG: GNAT family N-acetyltransferase [Oscillospiraceae bacterium]|jgi:ribosomal protein S18 acetylase RimI-like enzyme|nr:GNAT family N-acetyltransferase [Oscillospiraceae bacterium]